jgi:hypothetical protein
MPQVAATQGGVEMDLRRSLRHLCATLRRGRDHSQYLITPRDGEPVNLMKSSANGHGASSSGHKKPVDLPSLDKSELVEAYLERHKDSDYGFQVSTLIKLVFLVAKRRDKLGCLSLASFQSLLLLI